MLELGGSDRPKPKCYFTQSTLPTFVDHEQPPTKKKPFSTVLNQAFNHSLDVVVPEEAANRFKQALTSGIGTLHYCRMHMKLSECIEGDFFNQYIKSGNVLMLSEGRPGIDHIFSLTDGILRLEVDKPTYERTGLQGKAVQSEGRKHVTARFEIEINLRLPSMLRGHKGFARVVWAFKNVLNQSVTWLFYDLQSHTDGTGPVAGHQPIVLTVEPHIEQLDDIEVPQIPYTLDQDDHAEATELLEWLSVVTVLSPRLQSGDSMDAYLSRYRVPDFFNERLEDHVSSTGTVSRFRWHGFIPGTSIKKILLALLKSTGDDWFVIGATSFNGQAYTILKSEDRTMTWEFMD